MPTMTGPENDKFPRWQKIAIDQLGYALNLILILTIAALGFWFGLLKDDQFIPGSSAKCAMILSLWSLAFSALCGLACVLNRLWDFRGTARRAGNNPDAPTKDELRGLGHITWGLFYTQVVTFAVGMASLATTLLLTYGGKLV